MRQLCVLILMSLAVLRIQARLGPYYAHVCDGSDQHIECPGDFKIAFNGIIYTQYPKDFITCGSVSADDTTSRALCSTSLVTSGGTENPSFNGGNGSLVRDFQERCVGKNSCAFKLPYQDAISSRCNTSGLNVVRYVYSCVVTTGQDETVVCSDPVKGKSTTQVLACPVNTVISIEKILAQSTTGGSVCSDPLEPNKDFVEACAYTLGTTHDFYRLVVDTCSGWTACAVKGTLIENAKSISECSSKSDRNFQRIYYSCVPEQNKKLTLCSNDLSTNTSPSRITCESSYIKITNVVADRIYNLNVNACPVGSSAKDFAVFGCAVQLQNLQSLDIFTRDCNGKPSCDLNPTKYIAAPCGADNAKTRNWFSISYQCTKTPETDGYLTARACSGSQVTLQCPASAVLSLGSMYAAVLFSTTSDTNVTGEYSCDTALGLGNSEVSACTFELKANGTGSEVYKKFAECKDKNRCSVNVASAVEGPECIDYNPALKVPRKYTKRQLYDVQYSCVTETALDTSSSTSANAVGLGLGLTALFLVLIGAVVAVVIYRRRNRDGMTTKMSAPSAGNNYSNF